MERTKETLEARVRETPLVDRLKECQQRIGNMCAELRGPKMSIPVEYYDDDFYICTTLADAQATVEALQAIIKQMGEQAAVLAKDGMTAKAQVAALQRVRDGILKAINDSTYTDRRGRRCMAFKQLEEVIGKIEGSGKGGPHGRVDALSECELCHGPIPKQTTGGTRKRFCSAICKDSSSKDPAKEASRFALHMAVKRGEVIKPDSCQQCGKVTASIQGHHHDYAKPLDVQWLCTKCHSAIHRKVRNGQNS